MDKLAPHPKDTVEISLTALTALIDRADAALDGDSNDDEHDALYGSRETLADWTFGGAR